ncbi:HMG domain-containing protein 4-like [Acipenser ruthenus]|uniref:HMG domain-containing protein 4-like n=1 Tax=Acipenser ruthenus TaxID=7906 RepID=UPI00274204F4|nr:HMG domain-containing protein 4-like [Acipenser ruthenus]XP_058876956.1 HMG domain-containing protein 4-like [Acipenser ruthenus]XP_058876957.1 HMG domain-containing protein 4-like [Acipenser ruthenus]XP_058876958.1 HMG domain-containing protein 4-like [Acipenser ruthenus]XP_058876959.1 HMG domain-containing protein 4-like [Acipenser ruthenus]XP_058876961.1 HMG domain-containing protein 4-like [Acipenser ruthenus]XP_058876962.1 HMG domain-containing protein 4-like [Acipenser ruthenus]XP_0
MAFEEMKKKGEGAVLECGGIEEVGLVAGRSQREKKRSYKDLLREEEEIAAQVRKSSKKRGKDSEFYLGGGDSHKKKKKQHSPDEFYCGDFSPSHPSKKKKPKPAPPLPPPSLRDTDTAMGLLKAITSPLATGSKPASTGGVAGGGAGGGGGRSHSHKPAYPPSHKHSHHHSSKHGSKGPPKLSQRPPKKPSKQGEVPMKAGAEGLKVKLILSPKEKGEGERGAGLGYPSPHSGGNPKKSLKKLSRDGGAAGGGGGGGGGVATVLVSKTVKKKHTKEPLPAVGEEIEVEGRFEPGFYGDVSGLGVLSQGVPLAESGSSSGGELEAGELVIDDSYREVHSSSSGNKKKKKSKKSKKKKEREREKERGEKHKGERKHSKKTSGLGHAPGHAPPTGASLLSPGHAHSLGTPNHGAAGGGVYPGATPTSGSGGGVYLMAPPTAFSHHAGESQSEAKKKKKVKEEKDEKEKPRKKNMTAYQVFCKEYRVNINAEQPGLVFGELSRKLADVWKQLPEKDKLVWKQKAQYLQHKQNKAEATTVKRKSAGSEGGAPKTKGPSSRVATPHRKSPSGGVSLSLSPARLPESDPIDVAAHLQLLGESLSLIGHRLQETEGMVAVSGSLSVLLDSILCALGPLTCLTSHVPEINGCPKPVLSNTLDNVAYVMPGL